MLCERWNTRQSVTCNHKNRWWGKCLEIHILLRKDFQHSHLIVSIFESIKKTCVLVSQKQSNWPCLLFTADRYIQKEQYRDSKKTEQVFQHTNMNSQDCRLLSYTPLLFSPEGGSDQRDNTRHTNRHSGLMCRFGAHSVLLYRILHISSQIL